MVHIIIRSAVVFPSSNNVGNNYDNYQSSEYGANDY